MRRPRSSTVRNFRLSACVAASLFGALLAASAPIPALVQSAYVLEANDQITVVVRDHPEFSGDFLVPEGGVLVFPVVGNAKVTGLSLEQLSAQLTHLYLSELINPNVTVILKAGRTQQITVDGDVQKPGIEPLLPGVTLQSAISAAGGLPPDIKPSDVVVTLRRKDQNQIFQLLDVLAPNSEKNVRLLDGDRITIDAGTFPVYVVGQVKNPGLHTLQRGDDLLKAIAAGGGAADNASISHIRLTHMTGKDEVFDLVPALIHGEKQNLPKLEKGDLVTVPLLTAQYMVLGYVGAPGVYPLPEGQTVTLATAFSAAKGHDLEHKAKLSSVYITRNVNNKPVQKKYDLGRFLTQGKSDQNPTIQSGDVVYVPEAGNVPTATILQGIAAFSILYYYTK